MAYRVKESSSITVGVVVFYKLCLVRFCDVRNYTLETFSQNLYVYISLYPS